VAKSKKRFSLYHVSISAEGFVCGALAHCGYDVLVQYGANQPLYDLVAIRGRQRLLINVKGSSQKAWKLTQPKKAAPKRNNGITIPQAYAIWKRRYARNALFALVYFPPNLSKGTAPEIYMVSKKEIVASKKLSNSARFLHKDIQPGWKFSQSRIDALR
jgi:hypothetical protein